MSPMPIISFTGVLSPVYGISRPAMMWALGTDVSDMPGALVFVVAAVLVLVLWLPELLP